MYFTGWISGNERFALFSLADLYVMPSVSEPFGIVALEAIKMGTPVIVSKQSGVSEVLQHALKVDFWDIDEMAHQIVSVTRLPGLGATLAGSAEKEVKMTRIAPLNAPGSLQRRGALSLWITVQGGTLMPNQVWAIGQKAAQWS